MSAQKGIHDLPVIDKWLQEWKLPHTWTCIGNGPERAALQQSWHAQPPVQFLSPAANEEVMQVCAGQDVFVLPTVFEGSPVSLLETMSVGLVPVITDLPGGIREIVTPDIGYRIEMGNAEKFALAIRTLADNRALLNRQSAACRRKITSEFNVTDTAARYHALFARYAEFYRPGRLQKIKIGSRLDQPWLPSFITRTIRRL